MANDSETPRQNHTDDLTHYIVMTRTVPGHWGRGATISEACQNGAMLSGEKVRVLACDKDAQMDGMGGLQYTARYVIGNGVVMNQRVVGAPMRRTVKLETFGRE